MLGRRLAKGGMAELYLAKALGIGGFEKPCVLKLVLPHLTDDQVFLEMFLSEARLAATLEHPNVIHVSDIGQVEGEYFFVMDYVHGRDVRALLRANNPGAMPLQAALTIAQEVCEGLHYVHDKRDSSGRFLGLVHRDVSPSNVMVTYDGIVKLVDFGIAKATEMRHATRTGVLKGKVHYMAPEQCEGQSLDRRTDVFALGILLYEMTTGRPLFTGTNDYYVMSRIVRGVFARPREVDPAYPPELERIVLRALARDPDDRYVSAQALQVDIEDYARAAGLVLSSRALAETMTDTFGEAPMPNFDEDEEEVAPTLLHVASSSEGMPASHLIAPTDLLVARRSSAVLVPVQPRRRTVALALALGLGVPCLSIGAWAALRTGVGEPVAHASTPKNDDAGAAPIEAAIAAPLATPEPIAVAAPPSEPVIVPVAVANDPPPVAPTPIDVVAPAQPIVPDEEPVAIADEPPVSRSKNSEPARRRTTRASRERKSTTPKREPTQTKTTAPHDPDGLYPSGR